MSNISEKHLHIVSFDIPYPANYGGVIDVFFRIKSLHERNVKVHLHCFEYGRQHSEYLENFCYSVNYYKRATNISKLFNSLPYIVCSRDSKELLDNLKKDNYPILLEGLHCCGILLDADIQKRNVIVRAHNVEHEYYDNLAKSEKNIKKKMYLKQEVLKLHNFESILNKASAILAISQKDYNYFKSLYKNVYKLTAYNAYTEVNIIEGKGDYVLYHGNLEVSENYAAAEYLVETFKDTDINLKIAGMNPPQHLSQIIDYEDNIELVDSPDDKTLYDLIRNAQINILVTAQSTGLKLKLLNTLFNGRFCLVNEKMVEELDVNGLCYVVNDMNSIRFAANELMNKTFDQHQIEKRRENMKRFYNIEEATDLLLKLITEN
ncbi:MAG: glycosyltransferase family 1 protein [Lentimicrobiaceae bacterium]|nr:glycosyltransferase family 1 protein [Lentimicrobiaceae bacterium]